MAEFSQHDLDAERDLFGPDDENDDDDDNDEADNDDALEESIRRLPGSPRASDDGASQCGSVSVAGQPLPRGGAYVMSGRANVGNWRDPSPRRSEDGDSAVGGAAAGGLPRSQGRGGEQQPQAAVRAAECHVRQMPGFQELRGEVLLGSGVEMRAPCFQQGCSGSSGWMLYSQSGVADAIAPVRAMCFNIPAECFSLDATKFTDWQTPMNNSVRVASIAALLGLVATPLSKGFLCVQLLSNSTAQAHTLTVYSGVPTGPAPTKRSRAPRPTRPTTRTASAAARPRSPSA